MCNCCRTTHVLHGTASVVTSEHFNMPHHTEGSAELRKVIATKVFLVLELCFQIEVCDKFMLRWSCAVKNETFDDRLHSNAGKASCD
jgi:hypothetical protein